MKPSDRLEQQKLPPDPLWIACPVCGVPAREPCVAEGKPLTAPPPRGTTFAARPIVHKERADTWLAIVNPAPETQQDNSTESDCRKCLQSLRQLNQLRADAAARIAPEQQQEWRELLEEGRGFAEKAFGMPVCEHFAIASECKSCGAAERT